LTKSLFPDLKIGMIGFFQNKSLEKIPVQIQNRKSRLGAKILFPCAKSRRKYYCLH